MLNVNDNDFIYYSMPIHNPSYTIGSVCFRGDFLRADLTVKRPQAIASIVPEPLVYNDNKIIIVLMMVRELKEGFSEEHTLWNEIAIQIPVIHNGKPGLYVCENYSNDIGSILLGREIYGYPKLPSQISVEKNGNCFDAKLLKYRINRDILNLTFSFPGSLGEPQAPPSGQASRTMPQIILFKYIPSSTTGNEADVKKLVTIKYEKPVIHKQMAGEADIEILHAAPNYLKEAGKGNISQASFTDMEIHLIGGEVIHNYL